MQTRPEGLGFRHQHLHRTSLTVADDAATATATAASALRSNPTSERRVEHARALRAEGRYREAVATLTVGLASTADDPSVLADRGHTYVNLRDTEAALRDLQAAVTLDPTSFDAWYHLGLAQWLSANPRAAAESFEHAAETAKDDSSGLAARVWRYTSLVRTGDHSAAAAYLGTIDTDVELGGKNENYQLRARLYQGALSIDDVKARQTPATKAEGSLGFGIGIHHETNGETDAALEAFRSAAESTFWPAFGAAAGDAELARAEGIDAPTPEGYGLLGDPLYASVAHPILKGDVTERLAAAHRAWEAAPADTAAIREVALALASGAARYRDADAFLTARLEERPSDGLLHCDRGHFRLNVRRLADARNDLLTATELAPASHDPWYHLGLVEWIDGNVEAAVDAFQKALDLSESDSHRIAFSDWLYLGLRRLGRDDAANTILEPIHANMKTTGNNHLYLQRIRFYKGEITEADLLERCSANGLEIASLYGLGCWYDLEGRSDDALALYARIVDESVAWSGFAVIAAEAELLRRLP